MQEWETLPLRIAGSTFSFGRGCWWMASRCSGTLSGGDEVSSKNPLQIGAALRGSKLPLVLRCFPRRPQLRPSRVLTALYFRACIQTLNSHYNTATTFPIFCSPNCVIPCTPKTIPSPSPRFNNPGTLRQYRYMTSSIHHFIAHRLKCNARPIAR